MTKPVILYAYSTPPSVDSRGMTAASKPSSVLGEAATPEDTEISVWRKIIDRVDAANAITREGETFLVDQGTLEQALADPVARLSVLQAVAAGNALPAPSTTPGVKPRAASSVALDEIVKIVQTVIGAAAEASAIASLAKTIASGTVVLKRHWWGIELWFSKDAANALATLIGKRLANISVLLTALTVIPSLHVLGTVSAVLAAVLKGYAAWVDAANKDDSGIDMTVVAWILPVIAPHTGTLAVQVGMA